MFAKALAMTSLQVVGYTPHARLPFLSPALKPRPRKAFNNNSKQEEEATLSMSAGRWILRFSCLDIVHQPLQFERKMLLH